MFLDLLFKDDEFCKGVGRTILASGMLETAFKSLFNECGFSISQRKPTLGSFIRYLKSKKLLTVNGEIHFDTITQQRNYLAHCIPDLFEENIEETILPSENLTEGDVVLYAERANELAENLMFFVEIIKEPNKIESSKLFDTAKF